MNRENINYVTITDPVLHRESLQTVFGTRQRCRWDIVIYQGKTFLININNDIYREIL